jgi:hypothetical protein
MPIFPSAFGSTAGDEHREQHSKDEAHDVPLEVQVSPLTDDLFVLIDLLLGERLVKIVLQLTLVRSERNVEVRYEENNSD